MIEIRTNAENLSETVENTIASIAQALAQADFTQFFETSIPELQWMFGEIFLSRSSSDGVPWPEHSPVTVALYGPHPLLQLSTDLLSSLTSETGHSVVRIEPHSMEFGTNLVYAAIQNFGGVGGWGAYIPPREYMYFTETAADTLADFLEKSVYAVVEGAV